MLEDAVDHVRHGLEAAMRVPRGALRLAGRVLHLAHLVHVDEGVEVAKVHPGEGPTDRKALTLEPMWGDRYASHPPLPQRRVDRRQTVEERDVVDGDRRHGSSPPFVQGNAGASPAIPAPDSSPPAGIVPRARTSTKRRCGGPGPSADGTGTSDLRDIEGRDLCWLLTQT